MIWECKLTCEYGKCQHNKGLHGRFYEKIHKRHSRLVKHMVRYMHFNPHASGLIACSHLMSTGPVRDGSDGFFCGVCECLYTLVIHPKSRGWSLGATPVHFMDTHTRTHTCTHTYCDVTHI